MSKVKNTVSSTAKAVTSSSTAKAVTSSSSTTKATVSDANTNTNTNTNTNNDTVYTYATLMETNGEEVESWYFFIRKEGNEDALNFLNDQLDKVDFYIVDDLSTFDLEIDYFVSEQTAKQMTKIEMNHTSFHRKFDGKLKTIDFKFDKKDDNEDMIFKVFDTLGYGSIDEYIDEEDIDPEDLVSCSSDSDSSDDDDDKKR